MDTSLSYIIKKEKEERGEKVLVEHWVHGYMERKQIEYALGISADSANYWQKRLASQRLLRLWERPTARHQYESSLTSRGENYLESLGFEHRGYSEIFRQTKKPQRKHRLQVTRCSLGFLKATEAFQEQGWVFPARRFKVQGKEIECDKIWVTPGHSFIIECEQSSKGFEELEEKFQLYAHAAKEDIFAKQDLLGVRVLYIAPTPGRIPKIMRAASRAKFNVLFYFTDELSFSQDCRELLTGHIWQMCGVEGKVSL